MSVPGSMTRIEVPRTVLASKSATVTTAKAINHADFAFTAEQLAAADVAIISVATNDVNFLWDGSTPTATFGHPLIAGQTVVVLEGNAKINNLIFVQKSAAGVVTVTLEQYNATVP